MPSGLNATLVTPPVCPLRVRVSWPVAASHTFTVLSPLAEASRWPSGLNATLLTSSVCPLRVRVSWPVAASHTFTVPSRLAEARRLPSGLNATLVTCSVCPLRVRVSWPVAASHTFTVLSPAGGGEPLAVGAERHARDRAGVPLEGEDFLAGRGVPHLHRLVTDWRRRAACRRG